MSIFGTLTEGPVFHATAHLVLQLGDWAAKLRSTGEPEAPAPSREFGDNLGYDAQPGNRDGVNGASESEEWWEDDEDDLDSWGLPSPPEIAQPPPQHGQGTLEQSVVTNRPGTPGLEGAPEGTSWAQLESAGMEKDPLVWLQHCCQAASALGGAGAFGGDELALNVLRLLDSEGSGDEVAGDLLDLLGNGGVEIIEELLQRRKAITDAAKKALSALKSVDDEGKAQQQPRMPSYGTQVRCNRVRLAEY